MLKIILPIIKLKNTISEKCRLERFKQEPIGVSVYVDFQPQYLDYESDMTMSKGARFVP